MSLDLKEKKDKAPEPAAATSEPAPATPEPKADKGPLGPADAKKTVDG